MAIISTSFKSLRNLARDTPWNSIAEHQHPRLAHIDLGYQIPLSCVQTWETNLFGRMHHKSLTRYRMHNSAFHHFFYDAQRRDLYMESQWNSSDILKVYRSAVHGVTRADIFRYCFISQYGGFYSDIANAPPSPLLTYLSSNPSLILFTEASGYSQPFFFYRADYLSELGIENVISPFYNAFFAATPHHLLFSYIIDYIINLAPLFSSHVFSSPRQAILALTGPAAFNFGIHRYLEQCGTDGTLIVPIHNPRSIHIVGSEARYLQAKSYMDLTNEPILI